MTRTRKLSHWKPIAVILVLSIIMCLSGCIRYEMKSSFHADGTVDLSFTYAIDVSLSGDDQNGTDPTAEAQEKFENAGWSVEEYKDGDFSGFIATKKTDVNKMENDLDETDSFKGFSLEEDDGVYTLTWEATSVTQEASDASITADTLEQYNGYMKFVLEIQGEIIDTNGDVSNDDTTIEWNLMSIDEPIYAEFTLSGGKVFPSTTTITVNKDKTADVELLFTDVEDQDQFDEMEDLGWDISGKSKVTATQEGVELSDLGDILIETELGFDEFSLEEDDGIYTLEWDASGVQMELILELPNAAEDSNADSDEDNVLEWDLEELDEPVSAEFTIKKGGFPILLVCIIAGSVILVGIIILVIVLIVKKKKNKGSGPQAPNSFVEVPAAPQQYVPGMPQQMIPGQMPPNNPYQPGGNPNDPFQR